MCHNLLFSFFKIVVWNKWKQRTHTAWLKSGRKQAYILYLRAWGQMCVIKCLRRTYLTSVESTCSGCAVVILFVLLVLTKDTSFYFQVRAVEMLCLECWAEFDGQSSFEIHIHLNTRLKTRPPLPSPNRYRILRLDLQIIESNSVSSLVGTGKLEHKQWFKLIWSINNKHWYEVTTDCCRVLQLN